MGVEASRRRRRSLSTRCLRGSLAEATSALNLPLPPCPSCWNTEQTASASSWTTRTRRRGVLVRGVLVSSSSRAGTAGSSSMATSAGPSAGPSAGSDLTTTPSGSPCAVGPGGVSVSSARSMRPSSPKWSTRARRTTSTTTAASFFGSIDVPSTSSVCAAANLALGSQQTSEKAAAGTSAAWRAMQATASATTSAKGEACQWRSRERSPALVSRTRASTTPQTRRRRSRLSAGSASIGRGRSSTSRNVRRRAPTIDLLATAERAIWSFCSTTATASGDRSATCRSS
mmetsp:Transcript_16253/g.52919  ORF Transcript_16253/g.52919 Transcript_16253/m.52919 type:complete len:286 (-) Transcript_16253:119-976(-)